MTLQKMINELEKLKKKVGPRAKVVVNMRSMKNYNVNYYSHCEVPSIDVETIDWAIDDDFELQDGSIRTKTVVSIGGVT